MSARWRFSRHFDFSSFEHFLRYVACLVTSDPKQLLDFLARNLAVGVKVFDHHAFLANRVNAMRPHVGFGSLELAIDQRGEVIDAPFLFAFGLQQAAFGQGFENGTSLGGGLLHQGGGNVGRSPPVVEQGIENENFVHGQRLALVFLVEDEGRKFEGRLATAQHDANSGAVAAGIVRGGASVPELAEINLVHPAAGLFDEADAFGRGI